MAVNGSSGKEVVAEPDLPDDDDLDDVDRPPPKGPIVRSTGGPKEPRRRLPLIIIGIVLLAVVAVLAVVLSSRSAPKKAVASTTDTTNASGCTTPLVNSPVPPTGAPFVVFQDAQAKFTLSYPAAWKSAKASDPSVPLLLHLRADDLDTVQIRVVPLQSTVDTSNESSIKSFTDAVISGTNVNVLKQQALTINGLLGYYYFYSLAPNPCYPKITVVHSHFFLFPPHEMLDMVFQTTQTDFAPLAASFDQVIASLRTTA
jgi:hypothetical protein